MSKYLKTVSFWIDELIQDKDKYEIKEETQGKSLNIYVDVQKSCMGKIIGRNGNIITAIRNQINTISKKDKMNVKIIVKDI